MKMFLALPVSLVLAVTSVWETYALTNETIHSVAVYSNQRNLRGGVGAEADGLSRVIEPHDLGHQGQHPYAGMKRVGSKVSRKKKIYPMLSDEQCKATQNAALALGSGGPDASICPLPLLKPAASTDVLKFDLYGNWCGPGNGGDKINNPEPKDAVDRVCMYHDLCYKRNHYFSCECDLELIDDMPEAIAREADNPKAVAGGTAALFYFSNAPCLDTIFRCFGDDSSLGFLDVFLLVPGFGGVCLGVPGVGLASTLVNDLIIKGIGGLFMKGYRKVTRFAKCGWSCKYNSSRKRNIKNRVKALSEASNETEWTKALMHFTQYTNTKKNRVCARCMIGSSKVSELRSTAEQLAQVIIDTGLWRHDHRCNSIQAATSPACARALHRQCSHALPVGERENAFGAAHQLAPGTIIHSCTVASSIHRVKRADLNRMFQAPHTDCGSATGQYCTSKAHQYCMREHDSNFGGMIVDETPPLGRFGLVKKIKSAVKEIAQQNELLITCFPFELYQILPLSELQSKHGGCDSLSKTALIECRAAAANWCNAKGYKAGIVQQADGAKNQVFLGCWNPLLYPVGTPIGVDPRI